MQRFDDADLSKPPSEVLEIICKLGKGSYGSVYKARYKVNDEIVAVKKVPVDSDLADIVKEISIMQQCDSTYIVKCYGSLFDSHDLWICMEYCGAGSIADIMRFRGKPLNEDEIATVLEYSLKGLDYLHQAGNILLLNSGAAKLADFGVAGQLSDTLAKRNTVIGTPYWMAPEVIQEIGYNCSADIWSLGITAIEMADGKPPLSDIHPMRALFMIPSQPPPSVSKPFNYTSEFRAFLTVCLSKTPESRPTASALLQTDFIRNAKHCSVLLPLIKEASEAREKRQQLSQNNNQVKLDANNKNKEKKTYYHANLSDDQPTDEKVHTIVRSSNDPRAQIDYINLDKDPSDGTLISVHSTSDSFVIHHNASSLAAAADMNEFLYGTGNLNTMVVKDVDSGEDDVGEEGEDDGNDENDSVGDEDAVEEEDDDDDDDSGSVVVHGTCSMNRQETADQQNAFDMLDAACQPGQVGNEGTLTHNNKIVKLDHTINNPCVAAGRYCIPNQINAPELGQVAAEPRGAPVLPRAFQHGALYPPSTITDPDYLNRLSYEELEEFLVKLTQDLENELRNLTVRYRHKRQPLLDAIAEKTAQASQISSN